MTNIFALRALTLLIPFGKNQIFCTLFLLIFFPCGEGRHATILIISIDLISQRGFNFKMNIDLFWDVERNKKRKPVPRVEEGQGNGAETPGGIANAT